MKKITTAQIWEFLSTLSLRRATSHPQPTEARPRDFYPRSPCGERRGVREAVKDAVDISIHALLAESDMVAPPYNLMIHHFYPRSPCGERPFFSRSPFVMFRLFLSTLSLRRATSSAAKLLTYSSFLSTLSLRRATAAPSGGCAWTWHFYPRSPCGERRAGTDCARHSAIFLSTLSLRRATVWAWDWYAGPKLFLSTLSLRRATAVGRAG